MSFIDASLATLQPAPVFPELYQELWWESGVLNSAFAGGSAGSAFMQKGTLNSVANGSGSAAKLFTLNSSWSTSQKYAFEIALSTGSASVTAYASLWDITSGTQVTGSQVSTASATITVVRSSQFTLTPGHTYGIAYWSSSSSYGTQCIDASLIIFPLSPLTSPSVSAISLANPSGNTLKEAYYPLWVYSSGSSNITGFASAGSAFPQKGSASASGSITSATKLYALSSSWSTSQKFALEASIYSGNSSATAYIGLWDCNTNSLVSGSSVSTNATTFTLIRSGSFTLTPGHTYAVTVWTSNTSYTIVLTKAHLVALA